MKPHFNIISFLLLFLALGGKAYGQLEVFYTAEKPTIDGVIDANDPWAEEGWIDQAIYTVGGTSDHSSKFHLLYDDDIIYVGVQVSDATPYSTNIISYFNDCVELYFHMGGSSVEGTEVPYGPSTAQIRFQRDEITVANDGNYYDDIASAEGFSYGVVSDDAGWVLEASLPITALDRGGLFDGENLMFEINTSDGNSTDDTRTGQVFWQDASDNQWRWVEAFSAIHLSSGDESNNSNYHYKQTYSMCEGEICSWQGNEYTVSGTFYANYTTINGGDSIYELTLNVYERPENFQLVGLAEVTLNQIETYYAPISPVNYHWDAQNGNVISYPSSNSAVIQWKESGIGKVFAVSSNHNNCKSDTAEFVVSISPLDIEMSNREVLTIYPNPFTDILTIESDSPVKISIYDLKGKIQIVSEKKIVNVSELNAGSYILRIKDQYDKELYSGIIMKQK